jgi:uncharacterized protein DUF1353
MPVSSAARIFASYDPANPTVWRLEAPYCRATSLGLITVPVGFQWDGCSTPRFLWSAVPRWGPYTGAAVIHDWLYRTKPCSRAEADRVFLELLIEDRVSPAKAMFMFRGVQAFGSRPWQGAASGFDCGPPE